MTGDSPDEDSISKEEKNGEVEGAEKAFRGGLKEQRTRVSSDEDAIISGTALKKEKQSKPDDPEKASKSNAEKKSLGHNIGDTVKKTINI